jgi:DnaJ-class molecular chaperone
MSQRVYLICRPCSGTGLARWSNYRCPYCNGKGEVCEDK